jgi:hypothetical protein
MKNFNQLCVWHGTTLGESKPKDLEDFFKDELGVRVKYKCEVTTLPNIDENGIPDFNTGGRNDLFFYVHNDDIPKFSVPRLRMGIRWWEDVIVYNDDAHLYTKEFIEANPAGW